MEPRCAVWVVCRECVPGMIETVARLIDPFADPSESGTLERAAVLGSRRLLDRILSRVPSKISDQLLRLHDCNRALVAAVNLNDIDMATTLIRAYMDNDHP